MTYGHLQADCLYTGISSGPNVRYRVWEAFTFYLLPFRSVYLCRIRRAVSVFIMFSTDLSPRRHVLLVAIGQK